MRFKTLSEISRKIGPDDLLTKTTALIEILKKEYYLVKAPLRMQNFESRTKKDSKRNQPEIHNS
jgi:hypothetical protein